MPCWSSAAPWPRWRCWSSGSVRPTRFRWPKKTIRSTIWPWTGCKTCGTTSTTAKPRAAGTPRQRWALARKFLDYLEANAEEYWEVPQFELAGEESAGGEEEGDEGDDIYGAAYEGVTFRGSTEDDIDGEMLEGGDTGGETTDFELVEEAERIVGRLTFLATLAQLWKLAAVASFGSDLPAAASANRCWPVARSGDEEPAAASRLAQRGLSLPHPAAARHARGPDGIRTPPQRQGDAAGADHRHLRGDGRRRAADPRGHGPPQPSPRPGSLGRAGRSGAEAVLRGDPQGVRKVWRKLISAFSEQTLLYVALARSGHPQRIVASRGLQAVLRRLLAYLPRLGLLQETVQLISTIQEMETNHPVGPGAITEFDQMFKIGCRAIVRSLVAASEGWAEPGEASPGEIEPNDDSELIAFLEQATEALLRAWLIHSRGVRLSVLEAVNNRGPWNELKRFIEQYGSDLFTQRFMNHGNLRGILHQGVDAWLTLAHRGARRRGPLPLVRRP